MTCDTEYLKHKEDIGNNAEDGEVVTEEEVDETNTADKLGQSHSQYAGSNRWRCAV